MKAFVLASTVAIAAAAPATAGVTTVAGSYARSCYESAEAKSPSLDALSECDRALTVQLLSDDDRVATHVNRGILHMLRGNRDRATADYDAAIAMNPRQPEAYLNKGIMAFDAGDRRSAVALAEQAMALGTRKPGIAFYIRGMAYEQDGNLKAAYRDLSRAAVLEPRWSLPKQDLKRYQVVSR